MRITEVYVRLPDDESPADCRARVNLDVDGQISIKFISLNARRDGSLYVAMPSTRHVGLPGRANTRAYRDGKGNPYHYRDTVILSDRRTRAYVEKIVIAAYRLLVRSGRFEAAYDVLEPGQLVPSASLQYPEAAAV